MKTLSDKEIKHGAERFYASKNVKEFIKDLKDEIEQYKTINKSKTLSFNIITKNKIIKIINKRAGDKLIWKH